LGILPLPTRLSSVKLPTVVIDCEMLKYTTK
jgi:hypothetical protein